MRISDWSSDVCSSDLLDGGLVEGVVADRPTKVRVVDYDVEGADPDDLVMVPGDHHTPAFVSGWAVESVCVDHKWIASLDAARSVERRGGKECVSTCSSRGSLYHSKTKEIQ